MKKYQTKFPEQVEAVQLTASNYKEVMEWTEKECIVHYQDAGNMDLMSITVVDGSIHWPLFVGMYITKHKWGRVYNYTEEGFKKAWEEII